MTRRKIVCLKWTLVILLVIFCQSVYTRPQETTLSISSTKYVQTEISTESLLRTTSQNQQENVKKFEDSTNASPSSSSRDVKSKTPIIRESIKLVANQLLENPSNTSAETPIVTDTRIPPKLKNQLQKHKIKTRNDDGNEPIENSHTGIAVPVTIDELEAENKVNDSPNESSTSNEGISTWILLSNPVNKENVTSTEPTKIDEIPKKQKPATHKNKNKKPQIKIPILKRPVIGSTNKSDLIAGGSAINENVYNKIKDTVLSNVQKNKNTSSQRPTTISSTTVAPSTESLTTKKEVTKAPSSVIPVIKVTSKPNKKKNKIKQKTSTTPAPEPIVNESAMLPMEPKEQEIELEVSTPPTTTKKPKRSSTRKKNKTKKRKTTKPKPESTTSVSELKTSNKTKSTKNKKPTSVATGPISSQIYNYFSREVMPTVGVGVIGLAGLVGLASYFLYPFSTPVRRTFEVDKKDDIYKNNAEEYASEGHGQAEEEMLGTVLAGMPAHAKQKLNPYASQTTHVTRYPVKKEQDLRYRHVATNYDPKYNARYPQQKTGIAHAAVYAEPVNYNYAQYETRHTYTTEGKYAYDKGPSSYAPYPAVEPIYAAPQTGPSGVSSYGSDSSSSVVYGVKPASDSEFKPVYPFEGQFYSETTNNPTYPPTSMYLGSNNEDENQQDDKYAENENESSVIDNKFVVGNVPKELVDTATPAVVPEHGPRKFNRKKRSLVKRKRSITSSIEELLKEAKENNQDTFISNEIDESLGITTKYISPIIDPLSIKSESLHKKDISPATESLKDENTTTETPTTTRNEIVESVSTLPIDNSRQTTTESEISNELEVTTKPFRVYEVFPLNSNTDKEDGKVDTTTQFRSAYTETTTEFRSETTSTMPPSPSPVFDKDPVTTKPRPTFGPEVITYPPLNQDGGIFSFLKRLIDFKFRLGLSILQTTSESLNRYLRNMGYTVKM